MYTPLESAVHEAPEHHIQPREPFSSELQTQGNVSLATRVSALLQLRLYCTQAVLKVTHHGNRTPERSFFLTLTTVVIRSQVIRGRLQGLSEILRIPCMVRRRKRQVSKPISGWKAQASPAFRRSKHYVFDECHLRLGRPQSIPPSFHQFETLGSSAKHPAENRRLGTVGRLRSIPSSTEETLLSTATAAKAVPDF